MLSALTAALSFQAGFAPPPRASRSPAASMGAVGDQMPASALKLAGATGKKAVLFFYGADTAPSCSKQIEGYDSALPLFKELGVSVVGVRNEAGVKLSDDPSRLRLVVDEGDAVRTELGIAKDFFVLGGRESYVVDAKGQIACVFNSQFDIDSHIKKTLEAAKALPAGSAGFQLPDFSSLFGGN